MSKNSRTSTVVGVYLWNSGLVVIGLILVALVWYFGFKHPLHIGFLRDTSANRDSDYSEPVYSSGKAPYNGSDSPAEDKQYLGPERMPRM